MTNNPYTDGGNDRETPSEPIQLSYDLGDDEAPSTAIVRAIASVTNTSPLDLDPLGDVINPVYLDGLFQNTDPSAESVEFTFTYHGYEVRVLEDEVQLQPAENES